MNQIPKIMTGYANANCPKCGKLNITNPPHECIAPANQIPNIEETRNSREVEEINKWWLSKFVGGLPTIVTPSSTGEPQLHPDFTEALHQQLQKARQDWLREEIVKLERMKKLKNAHLGTAMPADEVLIQCENAGWNRARQTIIDRYQAELDQPNSQTPFKDIANRALEPKNAVHTPMLNAINSEQDKVCEVCNGHGNNGADDAQCLNCDGTGKELPDQPNK